MLDKLRCWSHYCTLFTSLDKFRVFSFILLTVNLFRHPTRIEHGLQWTSKEVANLSTAYVLKSNIDL